MRTALRVLAGLGALMLAVLGLAFHLLHAPSPPAPASTGRLEARRIEAGGRPRRYLLYVPARVSEAPPLLVVFHGSMGTAEKARVETGYGFERLADGHGFLVAYPQGHEGNWNDCRKAADYPARRLRIDDTGFFRAIVSRAGSEHGVRADRVFAAGVSSGAQFVLRLALEHPEQIAGAAVFGAGLPTRGNSDCTARGTPPPILLVNGTKDPINPYGSGMVSMFGLAERGAVLSAGESAAWFAARSGAAGPRVSRLQPRERGDRTRVERRAWRKDGREVVALLSVHGGGHVVPQATYRPPRLLGRVTSAIDGPQAAWSFFEQAVRTADENALGRRAGVTSAGEYVWLLIRGADPRWWKATRRRRHEKGPGDGSPGPGFSREGVA